MLRSFKSLVFGLLLVIGISQPSFAAGMVVFDPVKLAAFLQECVANVDKFKK